MCSQCSTRLHRTRGGSPATRQHGLTPTMASLFTLALQTVQALKRSKLWLKNGRCHRAASVRTPEQFLHEPWLTYQTFARTLSMASKPSLKSLDSAVRLRCLCFARAIQSEPFV